MPAGRPSKYTPELLEKAREYANDWRVAGRAVPSIVAFALYIGIHKARVYEWLKDEDKQEFHDIVARVNSLQEMELVDGGLMETYNPQLARFMLGKHGYSEKSEIDHKVAEVRLIDLGDDE